MTPLPPPPEEPSISDFQERVYQACMEIPVGKITTYKALAASIQCRSPRAVGQALKRNPFAPDVPCHRVVRSDLRLGGFAGQVEGPEVDRKRNLLLAEGIEFLQDDRIDPQYLVS